MATKTVSMIATPYVGIGVCAPKDGVLGTATFDNVQVTTP
jgi:hypothetical protein